MIVKTKGKHLLAVRGDGDDDGNDDENDGDDEDDDDDDDDLCMEDCRLVVSAGFAVEAPGFGAHEGGNLPNMMMLMMVMMIMILQLARGRHLPNMMIMRIFTVMLMMIQEYCHGDSTVLS